MTLDLSIEELQVIRQALRTCIDLGDRFFVFAPDTGCNGAKVYYGSGDSVLEDIRESQAKLILKKINGLMNPSEIAARMDMMRIMKIEICAHVPQQNPNQVAMQLET